MMSKADRDAARALADAYVGEGMLAVHAAALEAALGAALDTADALADALEQTVPMGVASLCGPMGEAIARDLRGAARVLEAYRGPGSDAPTRRELVDAVRLAAAAPEPKAVTDAIVDRDRATLAVIVLAWKGIREDAVAMLDRIKAEGQSCTP